MTLLDGILLVIMLISAVLAMIRGFAREVFSIAAWVIAAIATYMFWDDLLPFTKQYVSNESVAIGISVVSIFFGTLILVTLVTMKVSDFILDSKAGPLDRTLGFIFGAARGLLLVVIGVLFVNYFVPAEKQWPGVADAKTKAWLDDLGDELLNMLPEDPEAAIMDLRPDEAERGTGDGGAGTGDGASANPTGDKSRSSYASEDRNALQRQLEVSQQ